MYPKPNRLISIIEFINTKQKVSYTINKWYVKVIIQMVHRPFE